MPEVASPPAGAPPRPVVGAPPSPTPSMAPRQVDSPESVMTKPGSAPAAKPADTPPKSTTPAVSTPAPGSDEDYFSDLDKALKTGEPVKPLDKTAEAPAVTPAAAPKPDAGKIKPVSAPELRAELERLRTELKTRNTAHDDLQKKIADYEKRGKDTDALKTQYETQQKRIDALEAENRALKQETSPEFKEKYEEPFSQAASYAQAQIQQLQIQDPESGTPRMATWDDFVGLYGMPAAKAIVGAKEMFGDGAQLVMGHLQELHRLDFQKQTALQKEKAAWKERKAAEETKIQAHKEERDSILARAIQEFGETVEGYHDTPEDKEAAHLRSEGYRLFDKEPKTFQEWVFKEAHVKHRVAAYAPNQLQIQRLKSQLAEANKELEGFRNPEPGKVKRAGGEAGANGGADPNQSWEDAARKHMANT